MTTLTLPTGCVLCGNAAALTCKDCQASICSPACLKENWKRHKPECRKRTIARAAKIGTDVAHKYDLHDTAYNGLIGNLEKMITKLRSEVRGAGLKKLEQHAVRAFANHAERMEGGKTQSALFAAAVFSHHVARD